MWGKTFASGILCRLFITHSSVLLLYAITATRVAAAADPKAVFASTLEEYNSLLFVTKQEASSSSNTEKEIAFISVNGNLTNATISTINGKSTTAATKIPTTSVQSATAITSAAAATIQNSNQILKRSKRYLDILETSRIFYRANIKNNIVPKPVIWAHGYGFRANFPIEVDKRTRPFRRDTYDTLRELMDKHGFDGEACMLKAYCSAHLDHAFQDVNKGMLFKLLKHIFTLSESERKYFPSLKEENCQQILHSHCPLSFNNISPFTDDV